jgi:hypothetical protein
MKDGLNVLYTLPKISSLQQLHSCFHVEFYHIQNLIFLHLSLHHDSRQLRTSFTSSPTLQLQHITIVHVCLFLEPYSIIHYAGSKIDYLYSDLSQLSYHQLFKIMEI